MDIQPNDEAEKLAELDILNNNLIGWSDIYQSFKGDEHFDHRARFLYEQVIEPIYKRRTPEGGKFAVEVEAAAGEKLKQSYPENVVTTTDSQGNVHYSLQLDHYEGGFTPAAPGRTRLELNMTGGPEVFRFGLSQIHDKGAVSTQDSAFQLRDVVGFKVIPPQGA